MKKAIVITLGVIIGVTGVLAASAHIWQMPQGWRCMCRRMTMTKTSTDAQIVGSVSFINGDARQFTDSKEYLDCIREELPYRATSGFSFRTVTQDPAIRKAVDDIVYDFYGEENPCREEYYNLALSEEIQMGGI